MSGRADEGQFLLGGLVGVDFGDADLLGKLLGGGVLVSGEEDGAEDFVAGAEMFDEEADDAAEVVADAGGHALPRGFIDFVGVEQWQPGLGGGG